MALSNSEGLDTLVPKISLNIATLLSDDILENLAVNTAHFSK